MSSMSVEEKELERMNAEITFLKGVIAELADLKPMPKIEAIKVV